MASLPHSQQNAKNSDLPLSVRERLRIWLSVSGRQFRSNWKIFRQNRLAMIGLALIALFGLAALAHPLLIGTVWPRRIFHPMVGYAYDLGIVYHPVGPTGQHILGTDPLGRDVLSRLMASARPTFVLAMAAALSTAVLGTSTGMAAAYFGGRVDDTLLHFSKAFLLMPATIVMVIIGVQYQWINALQFGLIYGVVTGLGISAFLMRAHALKVLNKSFIEAAKVAGASNWRILTVHLLPHMLPLTAANMMLAVTGAVVADGFIWFTGLRNVRLNWGAMIYDALFFSSSVILPPEFIPWHALLPPAFALSVFALAFYLVSRGLQDVADPQLRDRQ